MRSDNPSGADNQQERLLVTDWLDLIPCDLGHYIAGFVDGEGSFNVPIVRERDRVLAFRVSLSFNVSHVGRNAADLLKGSLHVGRIRSRRDGVFYYEVTRPVDLAEVIFPFFDRFPLRGPKAKDLVIFRQITQLVRSGRHLTRFGLEEILTLRSPMNRGGKRRRSDEQIIAILNEQNPQRPYAELPL
jgi:hypothetical protein